MTKHQEEKLAEAFSCLLRAYNVAGDMKVVSRISADHLSPPAFVCERISDALNSVAMTFVASRYAEDAKRDLERAKVEIATLAPSHDKTEVAPLVNIVKRYESAIDQLAELEP